MKNIVFLLMLLILSLELQAQDLPAYITPEEKSELPAYLLNARQANSASSFINPPSSPVRTMAEWEELGGVLVTWTSFFPMLREIIRESKEECKVYVVCASPAAVVSHLNTYGIDTANVVLVAANFNSVWSRDYGPWSAYINDVDTLITVDWIYNRPRPFDDQIPVVISNLIGTPLYETTTAPWDLVHAGGNFMTDGLGTGFSSKLILNENPGKTEAAIDTIMKRFMGIDRYIKMDNLPFDVIHHIDMHMKLLNEETLLLGQYPLGVSDGPQIEANLQYVLANFNSAFGTPYKVVRIPMPPDQTNRYPSAGGDYWTHTNASFVNKKVLVPVYGGSSDSTAIRIFEEALPGYEIVGIDSRPSIPSLGAIHCIMKEIGTADPLLLVHQGLDDTYDDVNPYTVTANIKHRSGIMNAELYYRSDTLQAYSVVSMNNTSGDTWSGQIPAQLAGSKIYYYIEAESNSGKLAKRPMVAPAGYYQFRVLQMTAIEEVSGSGFFEPGEIFPNPASAITCMPVFFSDSHSFALTLHDISGRLLRNIYDGEVNQGEKKFFIDASTLQAGVYLIVYRSDQEVKTLRLIVK